MMDDVSTSTLTVLLNMYSSITYLPSCSAVVVPSHTTSSTLALRSPHLAARIYLYFSCLTQSFSLSITHTFPQVLRRLNTSTLNYYHLSYITPHTELPHWSGGARPHSVASCRFRYRDREPGLAGLWVGDKVYHRTGAMDAMGERAADLERSDDEDCAEDDAEESVFEEESEDEWDAQVRGWREEEEAAMANWPSYRGGPRNEEKRYREAWKAETYDEEGTSGEEETSEEEETSAEEDVSEGEEIPEQQQVPDETRVPEEGQGPKDLLQRPKEEDLYDEDWSDEVMAAVESAMDHVDAGSRPSLERQETPKRKLNHGQGDECPIKKRRFEEDEVHGADHGAREEVVITIEVGETSER